MISQLQTGREKYCETCQWDIPDTWDGDPLKLPIIPGQIGDDYGLESVYLTSSAESENDINDPSEDWIPGAPVQESLKLQSAGVPVEKLKRSTKPNIPHLKIAANSKDFMSVSVGAEKSWANSNSMSIDTANLEHIAEQLISSDELMKILAKRLGIPEHQVISADNMDSVFSKGGSHKVTDSRSINDVKVQSAPMEAPRDIFLEDTHEPDMDSDDDVWSDDEFEAGDFDEGKRFF